MKSNVEAFAHRNASFLNEQLNRRFASFFINNIVVFGSVFAMRLGLQYRGVLLTSSALFPIYEVLLKILLPAALLVFAGCMKYLTGWRKVYGNTALRWCVPAFFLYGNLWGALLFAMGSCTGFRTTFMEFGLYFVLSLVSAVTLHSYLPMLRAFIYPVIAWFLVLLALHDPAPVLAGYVGLFVITHVFAWYLRTHFFRLDNAVAQQLLKNENLVDKLEGLSNHDELSGVMNRRAFDNLIVREISQYEQFEPHAGLSLIILDIDHFKKYNDHYGHPEGDWCLTTVADCLRNAVREQDFVARIGGEEFAIILPKCVQAEAAVVARRIQTALLDKHIEHAASELGIVTISQGITQWRPGMDASALYREADAALYQAKNQGRNRFCSHVIPTADTAQLAAAEPRLAAPVAPARNASATSYAAAQNGTQPTAQAESAKRRASDAPAADEMLLFAAQSDKLLALFYILNLAICLYAIVHFRWVSSIPLLHVISQYAVTMHFTMLGVIVLLVSLTLLARFMAHKKATSSTAPLRHSEPNVMLLLLGTAWGVALFSLHFAFKGGLPVNVYWLYMMLITSAAITLPTHKALFRFYIYPTVVLLVFAVIEFHYPSWVMISFITLILVPLLFARYQYQLMRRLTATMISLLADNERLVATLTDLAHQDELTQLGNRRAFDLFMKKEFDHALNQAANQPLSLVLLDIDYFKKYNDRYGHPTGDQCLAQVAGCLRSAVRDQDFVARIGGEEFAVILPGSDKTEAAVVAERIRQAIGTQQIEHLASDLDQQVTVSQGIAQCEPGLTIAALYSRADKALYEAKQQGRNRYCQYRENAADSGSVQASPAMNGRADQPDSPVLPQTGVA